ncbi:hypothetical protein Hbut_0619 [Hyperthermus butylicus DSM 5456]|uniref:Uncharacterized protein n=1 Tax=Hyperthermus butylicus (strain DSM 5456 / JCM 9403 / PLM1-5) TaxID=415426 RepID=A2BKG7_HYPBU|nr:hypothetical protein Hbut_0619 [Hyperthermus butylicus DSM 5456]
MNAAAYGKTLTLATAATRRAQRLFAASKAASKVNTCRDTAAAANNKPHKVTDSIDTTPTAALNTMMPAALGSRGSLTRPRSPTLQPRPIKGLPSSGKTVNHDMAGVGASTSQYAAPRGSVLEGGIQLEGTSWRTTCSP